MIGTEEDLGKLERESSRSIEAKVILDSPLWEEIVEKINESLLRKMAQEHNDKDKCQTIAIAKVIFDQIQNYLVDIRNTGKLADIELQKRMN